MSTRSIDVIAAGHICLDVIPELKSGHCRAEDIFTPGMLSLVGPAALALGGSVANTGITLHRLGARAQLVGKVGDDLLGKAILAALQQIDPTVAKNMIIAVGEATSYSIVLSPPNLDRGFLHCPGTNDTFLAADLDALPWHESRLLHFGYPPLMRGTYTDNGLALARTFAAVRQAGALVSLDMAMPHADSTNWREWLRLVLPHVDIFAPSLQEIQLMLALDPNSPAGGDGCQDHLPASPPCQLAKIAAELHGLGTPIVVIKLGDQGLYLSTNEHVCDLSQRAAWRDFPWQAWTNRQLLAPCFVVEVVGTTGAGDCTIAGFLVALLHGSCPEEALRSATAVGAYSVQSADATSNIPSWSQIATRLKLPWTQRLMAQTWPEWKFCRGTGVYAGPGDLSCKTQVAS